METERLRPQGAPMAMTKSPSLSCRGVAERRRSGSGWPSASGSFSCSRARSVSLSVPTTLASSARPSNSRQRTSTALSTTCQLVSTSPVGRDDHAAAGDSPIFLPDSMSPAGPDEDHGREDLVLGRLDHLAEVQRRQGRLARTGGRRRAPQPRRGPGPWRRRRPPSARSPGLAQPDSPTNASVSVATHIFIESLLWLRMPCCHPRWPHHKDFRTRLKANPSAESLLAPILHTETQRLRERQHNELCTQRLRGSENDNNTKRDARVAKQHLRHIEHGTRGLRNSSNKGATPKRRCRLLGGAGRGQRFGRDLGLAAVPHPQAARPEGRARRLGVAPKQTMLLCLRSRRITMRRQTRSIHGHDQCVCRRNRPSLKIQMDVCDATASGASTCAASTTSTSRKFTAPRRRPTTADGWARLRRPVRRLALGKVRIDEDFAAHLDLLTRHCCDIAHAFGSPFIRIFSFYGPEGGNILDHRRQVMDRLAAMAEAAGDAGVVLLHENETAIYGETPDQVKDIFATVDSPRPQGHLRPGQLRRRGSSALRARAGSAGLAELTDYFHIKDKVAARRRPSRPARATGRSPRSSPTPRRAATTAS